MACYKIGVFTLSGAKPEVGQEARHHPLCSVSAGMAHMGPHRRRSLETKRVDKLFRFYSSGTKL